MTPIQEAQVIRHVQLEIQTKGIPQSIQSMEALIAQWHKLVTGFDATPAAVAKLTTGLNAASAAAGKTGQAFMDAHKGVGSFEKTLVSLGTTLTGISQAAGSLISPLNSLAGLVGAQGLGFASALQMGDRYAKMILDTSANFNKYGVGAGKMKAAIEAISEKTGLLRQDTVRLMQSYEKGFNFISLQGGEKLLTNLKNAVGANVEAMQEMMGNLSGIVSKFPDLEKSITRLNDLDKTRLSAQNRIMILTGQVSLAESKRFQDYINQNKQKESADKEAKKNAEAQIDAMNGIKKAMEDVALAINNGIIKYVKELAQWIKQNKGWILEWVPSIAKVAAGFTLAAVAGRTLLGVVQGIRIGMTGIASLSSGFGNLLTKLGGGGSATSGIAGGINNALAKLPGAVKLNQAGGLFARTGSAASASPLAATAAVAGGAAAGYGTGKLYDWGYKKLTGERVNETRGAKGVGVESGKFGLTVGAGAAAGALIGSVIPGLGTAVGALLGAIGGLAVASYNAVVHYKEVQAINRMESYRRSQDFTQWTKYQSDITANWQAAADKAKKYGDSGQQEVIREGGNTRVLEEKAADQVAKNVRNGKTGTEAMEGEAFDKVSDQRDKELEKIDEQISRAKDAGSKEAEEYFTSVAEARRTAWKFNDMQLAKGAGGDVDREQFETAARARTEAIAKQREAEQKYDATREAEYTTGAKSAAGITRASADDTALGKKMELSNLRQQIELKAGNIDGTYQQMRDTDTGIKALDTHKVASTFKTEGADTKVLNEVGLGNITKDQNAGNDAFKEMSAAKEKIAALQKQYDLEIKASTSEAAKGPLVEKMNALKSADSKLTLMINEAERQRAPLIKQQDQVQGNLLAHLNEQRMLMESQEKLYQSHIRSLDSIIDRMQITGAVDMSKIGVGIEDAIKALDVLADKRQRALDQARKDQAEITAITTRQIADAQKVLMENTGTDGSDVQRTTEAADSLPEDKRKKVYEALVEVRQKNAEMGMAESETAAKLLELQTGITNRAKEEYQIRSSSIQKAYATLLEQAGALNTRAELAVQLVDNMAVGFQASAQMRMESARAIDREIALMESQTDEMRTQMKLAADKGDKEGVLKYQNDILNNENKITQQKIKQAQILKTIRDGYFSAINAMTIGTGMIGKFQIDATKNLGLGVKYLGMLRSMSSGGTGSGDDSRGAREASGFTAAPGGGLYGPKDRRMYKTYDGGEKLAEEVRGKTQDLYKEAALSMGGSASRFDKSTEIFAASTKALDASINRLRGPGGPGTINSGGTGAYGANDSNTGRLAAPNIPIPQPTAPAAPATPQSNAQQQQKFVVPAGTSPNEAVRMAKAAGLDPSKAPDPFASPKRSGTFQAPPGTSPNEAVRMAKAAGYDPSKAPDPFASPKPVTVVPAVPPAAAVASARPAQQRKELSLGTSDSMTYSPAESLVTVGDTPVMGVSKPTGSGEFRRMMYASGIKADGDRKAAKESAMAIAAPPKHHTGGTVKGPEGSEQLIIAQGGEKVSSISEVKGSSDLGTGSRQFGAHHREVPGNVRRPEHTWH
jgi:hypothetical protein